MSDRAFVRILLIAASAGMIVTAAHCIYFFLAYQNASILQFIARELWL